MRGLGQSGVSALASLVRHGSMRLGDLAALEGISAPTLSRVIANIEANGYLRRDPDPSDGRAFLLTPTEKGEQVLQELRDERTHVLTQRIERLSVDEAAQLFAALPIIEKLTAEDEN
jgi:DNA-binding MarR family transcriptional regulator